MPSTQAERASARRKISKAVSVCARPARPASAFETIRRRRPDLLQHLPDDAEARLRLMEAGRLPRLCSCPLL
jgi:hypothetical protein